MNTKKLILFDLDGTLIDWRKNINTPTDEFFHILNELRNEGFLIMVASGRLKSLIEKPIGTFEFDGYILSDGAHVIVNQNELFLDSMDDHHVQYLKNLAINHGLEYGLLYKDSAFLVNNGYTEDFLNRALFDMNKVLHHEISQPVLKMYIHVHKDQQDFILDHLSNCKYALEEDYNLIEIRSENFSKASGLKLVLDHLDIKSENTYFFGDGFNDIEIFKMVGHPFVMGNAHKDLHTYGTVCKSIVDNGVYLQLKEILEKEKARHSQ